MDNILYRLVIIAIRLQGIRDSVIIFMRHVTYHLNLQVLQNLLVMNLVRFIIFDEFNYYYTDYAVLFSGGKVIFIPKRLTKIGVYRC